MGQPEKVGEDDQGHIEDLEEVQEYGKEGLEKFLLNLKHLSEEALEKDMNVYFAGD